VYESGMHKQGLETLLAQSLSRDRATRYTNVGIHKDDLTFLMNDFPVKRFGSQGQQKSFVIAIRLAQYEFTYNKMGYQPILLFDDIFDKLDDQRVNQLVKLLGNDYFGQVFITDTQRQRINYLFEGTAIDHEIFSVESGIVESKIQLETML
jgi:DNA replication and repair protein RecF